MDLKCIVVLYCAVLSLDTTNGCEDLVEDFLLFRDGLVQYLNMCEGMVEGFQEDVEEYLGFPLNSDERLTNLLCDVADVDDIKELKSVLKEHIAGPVSKEIIIDFLTDVHYTVDYLPESVDAIMKYQRKIQPWLAKTNFPHTWPVPNTGKKETARMMVKGDESGMNLITYDSTHSGSNFIEWANRLLNANSHEDYLAFVEEDYIRPIECYTAMQDVFRDNRVFQFLPDTAHALMRVHDHLEDIGLIDMIPE